MKKVVLSGAEWEKKQIILFRIACDLSSEIILALSTSIAGEGGWAGPIWLGP